MAGHLNEYMNTMDISLIKGHTNRSIGMQVLQGRYFLIPFHPRLPRLI